MESEGNRPSRTPVEQKFESIGTFHTLPDGTIVPDKTKEVKEATEQPDSPL